MTRLLSEATRHPATIISRQQTVDALTGEVTVTEETWAGDIDFVENYGIPRQADVPVEDAWAIAEIPLDLKMLICCRGKQYSILKLAKHGSYEVAVLKAAVEETYSQFRADMVFEEAWGWTL